MSILTEIKSVLFYPELTFCEEIDLLLEVKKQRLMGNTDAGRKYRAIHEVRTRPMDATIIDETKRIWLLEYNFKSFPSTEEKRHWGYILYDQPNQDIKEVYCDCKDFFFRLYAPFVRKKLATWNLTPKYKKASTGTWASPHNKQWTIITNSNGSLYVCKHMYAALKGYVEDETPEKSTPVTPVKIEVSIDNKPAKEDTVFIPTADIKKWGTGSYAQRMKQNFIINHYSELGHRRVNITKWL